MSIGENNFVKVTNHLQELVDKNSPETEDIRAYHDYVSGGQNARIILRADENGPDDPNISIIDRSAGDNWTAMTMDSGGVTFSLQDIAPAVPSLPIEATSNPDIVYSSYKWDGAVVEDLVLKNDIGAALLSSDVNGSVYGSGDVYADAGIPRLVAGVGGAAGTWTFDSPSQALSWIGAAPASHSHNYLPIDNPAYTGVLSGPFGKMREWTSDPSYAAVYPSGVTPGTGNYSLLMRDNNEFTTLNASSAITLALNNTDHATLTSSYLNLRVGVDLQLNAITRIASNGDATLRKAKALEFQGGLEDKSGTFNLNTTICNYIYITDLATVVLPTPSATYAGMRRQFTFAPSVTVTFESEGTESFRFIRVLVDSTAWDGFTTRTEGYNTGFVTSGYNLMVDAVCDGREWYLRQY